MQSIKIGKDIVDKIVRIGITSLTSQFDRDGFQGFALGSNYRSDAMS